MQGYVNQSPVKQVWLPMDYAWISSFTSNNPTFKDFANAYKEKYGIDLYGLIELKRNDEGFYIKLQPYLFSAYSLGDAYGMKTSFVSPNAIVTLDNLKALESDYATILTLGVKAGSYSPQYMFGINIQVPPTGIREVTTLDDLAVSLFEN